MLFFFEHFHLIYPESACRLCIYDTFLSTDVHESLMSAMASNLKATCNRQNNKCDEKTGRRGGTTADGAGVGPVWKALGSLPEYDDFVYAFIFKYNL